MDMCRVSDFPRKDVQRLGCVARKDMSRVAPLWFSLYGVVCNGRVAVGFWCLVVCVMYVNCMSVKEMNLCEKRATYR